MARSVKTAVIGAGPGGLVAARELRRQGHEVTVFEKSTSVGGTWVYDPTTDSDRVAVHGSLYRSLRTNLPRQLMGFLDYPFPGPSESFVDPRAFPAHEEVLAYLEGFARDFGVLEMVRFGAEVVRVWLEGDGGEWSVEWRNEDGSVAEERFEAVVVASGHHSVPRIPEIPGIDKWRGKQIHSHNYRIPEHFRDQVVVLIGMGASSRDISREISKVAKEVHIASRAKDTVVGKLDNHDNIWQHKMVKCVHEDCEVEFDDGASLHADCIFYCTGYKYHFPFLETIEFISIEDNRVGPLYKHVFPPAVAPWLSFVGIPNKVIFNIMLQLQSKWIAHVLSSKVVLPSEKTMMASVEAYYQELERVGQPKHHTHYLLPNEIEYLNWLTSEVSLPPMEEWRIQIYRAAIESLKSHNDREPESNDSPYKQSYIMNLTQTRSKDDLFFGKRKMGVILYFTNLCDVHKWVLLSIATLKLILTPSKH
ncbi:flavin-containing monooxygenase FMO GS-OX5-like isoform X2 [Dioscorea cayenensis subsp. rotundata]|uniref:Flavin-containing monooxygenase n=1 Tax=Dioscorea cayennensis subsp. rotundata TaxID=55577 RepID=A0AB40CSK8_DIOCR|nr:flavin-containing monooxygenase FMO GS-OX5-like isoform X2 [Dioscorea cayenensis subsp. rotundata]